MNTPITHLLRVRRVLLGGFVFLGLAIVIAIFVVLHSNHASTSHASNTLRTTSLKKQSQTIASNQTQSTSVPSVTKNSAPKPPQPSHSSAPSSGAAQQGSTSSNSEGSGGATPSTLYVQPGTQGYRGSSAALTVYSAANGQVPPNTACSWNQTYKYLRCNDTDLTLDHVYIEGGLYWAGCGSLTVSNSVFDWYPSQAWFDVYNACTTPNANATITASNSTFETSPTVIHYTGGSDIGGITEYTGDVPMNVTHSLVQGFSQGFDPGGNSTISSSEIYVQDNICNGGSTCHGDGLFSQGGDAITYQNNYIVVASDATSAIFYQSSPNSNGNSVIGNYLQGGSYALYNEDSNNLTVKNNTFGGSTYGNCDVSTGASWGVWTGNVTTSGAVVTTQGSGCS